VPTSKQSTNLYDIYLMVCVYSLGLDEFHLVPTSKQSTNLYDIYLMVCVQFWTPDYGRKDRPKHVERYSINSKTVHLVGFTI
jgi:hypothetical protein